MKFGLLLVAVGVFVLVGYAKTEVDVSSALVAATRGAESGKEIADWLKSTAKDTTVLLARVTSKIGPFLGAIGPLFSLISILLPKPESEDYRLMKENFKRIETNFNRVFNRLEEVKSLVQKSHIKIDFGRYEDDLLFFIDEFGILKNLNKPKEYEAFKKYFIKKYEKSDLERSMYALYRGIVKPSSSSISGSLTRMAVKTTAYNRKETQKIIKRIIFLVMQGTQIQLAYYQLADKKSLYDIRLKQWTKRNKEMVEAMSDIQKTLDKGYFEQSGKDAKQFAEENQKLSNYEFAERLQKYLSEKYDFRYWHVVAYRQVSGDQKHYLKNTCPAFQRMPHMFGRNFAFADVKKSPMPWIQKSDIQSEIDKMSTPYSAKATYENFPDWMKKSRSDESEGGEETMLSCVYRAMGVVKQPDAHIACVPQRCASRSANNNLIFAAW